MTNKLAPLFAYSKDYYLQKIRLRFPDLRRIFKEKQPVVICGAARMGQSFLYNLNKAGIKISAFIDQNKALHGKKISGVPVISYADAKKKFPYHPVCIASLLYESEMAALLKKYRFSYVYPLAILNLFYPKLFVSPEYEGIFNCLFDNENQEALTKLYEILSGRKSKEALLNLILYRLTLNKKYIDAAQSKRSLFKDRAVLPLTSREAFVDCGAYNGDSIAQFLVGIHNRYQMIYSFEPDRFNYEKLRFYIDSLDNPHIITYRSAIYKQSGKVRFDERGTVDSMISTNKDSRSVPTISLDDFFADSVPPTFIKMDIESGEIDALMGAKELLKKYKPKLAISCYHRYDHLWRIPLLIKSLNNDYRLFLRHYSNEIVDTMCIAI